MGPRPAVIKFKKRRDKVEVITYSRGARGTLRKVGSVLIERDALRETLSGPIGRDVLGLTAPRRALTQ
jgi:hypothetical protein